MKKRGTRRVHRKRHETRHRKQRGGQRYIQLTVAELKADLNGKADDMPVTTSGEAGSGKIVNTKVIGGRFVLDNRY